MTRPVKIRKVEVFPVETYFKPLGKKKCECEEVTLKIEELEAVRLKDLEDLSQEEGAQRMGVSRQTYQNILDDARRKITLALVEGRAIHICGGDYTSKHCLYECQACQEVYPISYQVDKEKCPKCGGTEVACYKKQEHCAKWCKNN